METESRATLVSTDFWSGYRTMLVCDAAQRAAESHHPMEIAHVDAEVRAGARVVP